MLCLPKQTIPQRTINTYPQSIGYHIYLRILQNKTFISYIALFGLLNCGEWCFLTLAPFTMTINSITRRRYGAYY